MDNWYGTKALLLFIENLGKFCYVPFKNNRQVDDSGGVLKYKRIDELNWNSVDLTLGKMIKIKEFPKEHKVKYEAKRFKFHHMKYNALLHKFYQSYFERKSVSDK